MNKRPESAPAEGWTQRSVCVWGGGGGGRGARENAEGVKKKTTELSIAVHAL